MSLTTSSSLMKAGAAAGVNCCGERCANLKVEDWHAGPNYHSQNFPY